MKGTMKCRAQRRTATRIWWPILSQLQLHEEKAIESEDLHGSEEAPTRNVRNPRPEERELHYKRRHFTIQGLVSSQDRISKTEVSLANSFLSPGFASPCVFLAWRLRPFLQLFGGAFSSKSLTRFVCFQACFLHQAPCVFFHLPGCGFRAVAPQHLGWISLDSPRDGSPSDTGSTSPSRRHP